MRGNSPWGNYGAEFAAVAFYRDQLGVVHLKGLAKGSMGESTDDVREY
jgi:hypothetical protein